MAWTDPRKKAAAGGAAPAAAPAPSAAPPPPTAGAAAPLPAATPPPPPVPPAQPAAQTPPAPPAGAPAAEAPAARRGRGRSAAAAPAAAPAAPAANAVVTTPAAPIGFLALLNKPGINGGTLARFLDGQMPAGEPNVFPMIELRGGDAGGDFDFNSMNVEGVNDDLPRGKDPFYGIVIGYRYELIMWPKAYERGVKAVPRCKGILPYEAVEIGDIVQKGIQRYSFRNRDPNAQTQYDPYGHPQIYLDALVYDITAGLITVRTTGTYESAQRTAAELRNAFPNGEPQPTPVIVTPFTFQVESKSKTWSDHGISFRQQSADAEAVKVIAAFKDFFAANGNDPALTDAVTEWGKMTITDEMIENMRIIGEMRG